MAMSTAELNPPRQMTDLPRTGLNSPFALWSAFLLSVLVHGTLVGALLYRDWLNSTRYQPQELAAEKIDFHAVGLFVKPQPKQESRHNPNGPEQDVVNPSLARFNTSNAAAVRQPEVPSQPPVNPLLPQQGNNTIGPGRPTPSNVAGPGERIVAPNGIFDGTPAAARSFFGNGNATFFSLTDKGKRVVYVVDRSASMSRNDALVVAKQQLIASLNGLTPKHRFQVIFYDEAPHVISLTNGTSRELMPATTRNIEKICVRVSVIKPHGGTLHMAALRPALRLRPDVIFFLTDADAGLTAEEMNEVRVLNKSKARIHCIEFGDGPNVPVGYNFLKDLAAKTGGKYTYRDVKKFQRR
jgi:von Willebrand factor type A domain